jgi:hypothetical protein
MEIFESKKRVIIHMKIPPNLSYFCPADRTSKNLPKNNI